MLNEIGNDIDRFFEMLIEEARVKAGVLFGSKGVQVAADRFERLRDLLDAVALSPLEHHVLDEMRDAVRLELLIARADIDPDADRDGADGWDVFGDNADAVRQNRFGVA